MTTDYSYIGVGKVHLRVKDSAAALAHIGNCSALNFSIEEETKPLKDFTQSGGGTYNEVRRVSGVTCKISVHDLSPDNLAKAIFGDTNAITAATVTEESITAYAGGLSVTDYPIDLDSSITVKHAEYAASARANSTAYVIGDYYLPASPNGYVYKCTASGTSAGSPPSFSTTMGATFADGTATFRVVGVTAALTEDTHYTASAGGVSFAASPNIYDGEEALVTYTKKAGNAVEALLNSSQEYELFFDGLNEARTGKAATIHAFRVKLGAAKDLAFIGEDYAVIELEGKVLKDTTKNGTTVSQYFKAQIVT